MQPLRVCIYDNQKHFPITGSTVKINTRLWNSYKYNEVTAGFFGVQLTLQTALNTDFNIFVNSWPSNIASG